ncbi:hypothetical protein GDO86_009163 [Hymenochirus boettgeri]|uniref:Uncharacterized protein n=1 Tax=Hymenochirus boettgeri TaxID=247094 RepID=A0A8T2JMZ9_9PIPI|nr:hypothetical protein GDO86_009163 [Hymenochirus boettgeri]
MIWLLSCCLDVQFILCILFLGFLFQRYYPRIKHVDFNAKGRAVLITGCDSGFGNLLARRLLDMGFHVFAACLFPDGEGAQSLKSHGSPGQLYILRLDVTSDKEMAEVKIFVEEHLPEKGLWGIVNNAGISMWGITEWFSIDKYQQIVDINLLGSIRTTLAFAPLVRHSKGRMVFLSSISAFVYGLNGIYSMTKAAIEKFCDPLRQEMKQFGVLVSIIEPGNYSPATNIQAQKSPDEVWNSLSGPMKEIYDKDFVSKVTNLVNRNLGKGNHNAYEVVDSIVDALTSDKPKTRYLVANFMEKLKVYLCLIMPSLYDYLLSLAFRK